MASSYSTNLAIELPGTGDQVGTWGNTVNTNLGTLIEQAVSGYVTQAITDGADTTITIPNGATGVARNMFLELTGALTATRNLIVPANKKLYFIYNNTTGGFAVTVKVTGLTGVSVPSGAKLVLVSNGTDIITATTVVTNANLTGHVTSVGNAAVLGSFTSLQLLTALTDETGTGANVFATSPVLTTPNIGTPSAGVATNLTGLPLTTGVTGTLPVANGGTSAATLSANAVLLGNGTSALQTVAPSTSGNLLTSNGTTWQSTAPAAASGGFSNLVVLTGSGNWTVPAGITKAKVTVVAGGGAGNAGAGGGGGGGAAIAVTTGLTPGNTVAYVVGAAAASSSFSAPGGTISATAGGGGGTFGGAGGIGSGGTLNIQGGGGAIFDGVTAYASGGSSILGGGARGSNGNVTGGAYGGGGSGNAAGGAGTIMLEY